MERLTGFGSSPCNIYELLKVIKMLRTGKKSPQHSQGLPVIQDSEILEETAKYPWQERVSKYFSVPQA